MLIDIHVHTRRIPGPTRGGKQAYCTPGQLIERYDELGIEKGVVLPGVNPECAFVPQSNEEVIEVACDTGRFIPFCNVDPRAMSNSADAQLGHLLGHYADEGCKGVGEVCANLPFAHPMVHNLFRCTQEVGLPLTFHIAPTLGGNYGLYDDPGLPQLEQSLQEFPQLKFFGHSQAFWAEIGRLQTSDDRAGYPSYPVTDEGVVPQLMRKYPNLYGDLSANSGCNALARDEPHAAKFLEEFQDRLMFGTDICAPGTPTPLVDLLIRLRDEKKITEDVFDKVARRNAIGVLGL